MTVPQSLLAVALAVGWLIVLVPSSSRRRGHVRESVEGSGFRVLRRSEVKPRRMTRRERPSSAVPGRAADVDSEGHMASQQDDVGYPRADDDTVVLDAVDAVDAARAVDHAAADHDHDADDDALPSADPVEPGDAATRAEWDARDEAHAAAQVELDDEYEAARAADDEEVRRQYQAWRESTRAAQMAPAESESAETAGSGTAESAGSGTVEEPANVRPIPRRPGRGTYDPEAAEQARAYKFAKRRRTVLVLSLLIVAFALAAILITATAWIGAGIAFGLLLVFMAYLRRQVKIEADIRERRLAKLQRARQIRPERSQTAEADVDPYAQRAPRPHPTAGPVHHRSSRVVLDLDDDDPGFDDLEQYEPMEYRRAVGQ